MLAHPTAMLILSPTLLHVRGNTSDSECSSIGELKVLHSEYCCCVLSRRISLVHCPYRGSYTGVKLFCSVYPTPRVTIHSPKLSIWGGGVRVCVCVWRGAYLSHTPAMTVALWISIATPFLMVSGQYKLTSNHSCSESWLCPHPRLCQRERTRRKDPLVIQNHSSPAQQRAKNSSHG